MTSRFRFVGAHVDDLHDGRPLVPGGYVTLTTEETSHRHNQQRIDDGLLIAADPAPAAAGDATDGAADLAHQHGVDLAAVQGTGADGRIVKSDVEQHIRNQEDHA